MAKHPSRPSTPSFLSSNRTSLFILSFERWWWRSSRAKCTKQYISHSLFRFIFAGFCPRPTSSTSAFLCQPQFTRSTQFTPPFLFLSSPLPFLTVSPFHSFKYVEFILFNEMNANGAKCYRHFNLILAHFIQSILLLFFNPFRLLVSFPMKPIAASNWPTLCPIFLPHSQTKSRASQPSLRGRGCRFVEAFLATVTTEGRGKKREKVEMKTGKIIVAFEKKIQWIGCFS